MSRGWLDVNAMILGMKIIDMHGQKCSVELITKYVVIAVDESDGYRFEIPVCNQSIEGWDTKDMRYWQIVELNKQYAPDGWWPECGSLCKRFEVVL